MAHIVVLHDDLDVLGGAESVYMHTLEAIQSDHDVTLINETDPDLRAANEYFGTDVTDVVTETVAHVDLLERFSDIPLFSTDASILDVPFKHRLLKHRLPEADLVISTRSREVTLPRRAIHYVPTPRHGRYSNATGHCFDSSSRRSADATHRQGGIGLDGTSHVPHLHSTTGRSNRGGWVRTCEGRW
jgi:hypothetical protein